MVAARTFDRAGFDRAFDEVILGGEFFEPDGYYPTYRPRYEKTLRYLAGLDLPRPARILEVGGGQIVLLCHALFEDTGTIVDVNNKHAQAIKRVGLEHRVCDLLRDDLPDREAYDAVVLCEVVEHLPIPLHLVLEKMKRWIKPGGYVFLTTPNLYRLRNIVRLMMGKQVFCPLRYPPRGHAIGHPFEFSADHLRWHLEAAGLHEAHVEITQLANTSMKTGTKLARALLGPVMAMRPLWKENIVAWARRGAHDDLASADEATALLMHSFNDAASITG
jgi:SAM-dependent methyltransferase